MLVEHFFGKKECNTCEELKQVLELRTKTGVNEFTITLEEDYPFIIMYVKNDYACLNYYWKENDPGYSSLGKENGLEYSGDMVFYTGTEKQIVMVPNYAVVSFSQAKEAVIEFFDTRTMPKSIEWEEL